MENSKSSQCTTIHVTVDDCLAANVSKTHRPLASIDRNVGASWRVYEFGSNIFMQDIRNHNISKTINPIKYKFEEQAETINYIS